MFNQATAAIGAIDTTPSATGQLNSVALTSAQIAAALQVIALLPEGQRVDPRAQAMVLQAYALDAGFTDEAIAGAALHARVTALAKWTAAHDPLRQSDPSAVFEATARHPLVETDDGIGFEGSSFQEMVLFIEELPW
jgi:hypothetical protein